MTTGQSRPPLDRAVHTDAAWTLVRWIGIPLVLVGALYFIQRGYDQRHYAVVTHQGAMPSAEEIARAPVAPGPAPALPGTPSAPLVPLTPPATPFAPSPPPTSVLQPISQPDPPYPPRALDADKEGVVRLRLTVAPDGRVSSAVVLSAEPSGWFERAAQDGVRRWRYEPSEYGGTADVDIEFKLK